MANTRFRRAYTHFGGTAFLYTTMLLATYVTVPVAFINPLGLQIGAPFKTVEETSAYTENQKKEFGIEKQINLIFVPTSDKKVETAGTTLDSSNTYTMFLKEGKVNKFVIKHELSHIALGHINGKYNFFKYLFIYEPAATYYSLFK